MDKLKLIEPTMEYANEILSFRQEFLDCGDSMDGSSYLRKFGRALLRAPLLDRKIKKMGFRRTR